MHIISPQGYKTGFMLNLTEHEISTVYKNEMLKIKMLIGIQLSYVVFILLINVPAYKC